MNAGIEGLMTDLGYIFMGAEGDKYGYRTAGAPYSKIVFTKDGDVFRMSLYDVEDVTSNFINELLKRMTKLKHQLEKEHMEEVLKFQRLIYKYSSSESMGTALIHYLQMAKIDTIAEFQKHDMESLSKTKGIGDALYRTLIKVRDALRVQ